MNRMDAFRENRDSRRPAPTKPARILLECTWTYLHEYNTGIARVVRGIVNNAIKIGRQLGIPCQPVIIRSDRFHSIPFLPFEAIDSATRLEKKMISLIARMARSMPHLRHFLTQTSFGRILMRMGYRLMKMAKDIVFSILSGSAPTEVSQDDLLITLDSSWQVYPWSYITQLRKKGTVVAAVLYDMLPVRFPEAFYADLVAIYRYWLAHAGHHHDFFMAISNATRDDFFRYTRENVGASMAPRVEVFQLGADLHGALPAGRVRPEFQAVFQGGHRPFLMVGTLEPRKNHQFLLDAFDLVWKQGVNARLAIIGKVGWMCNPLVERIERHPQLRRNLFMFNDANDAEVAYAYENARAMVFPSIAEGFGLPIIESLSRGLPVLASDIPVHREVGGKNCTYFSLASPAELAELLLQSHRQADFLKGPPPGQFRWVTWQESAQMFLEKILGIWREKKAGS